MSGSRGGISKPKEQLRRRVKAPDAKGAVRVAHLKVPRTLGTEGRREWRRIAPTLEEIGILATVDRSVLIQYCDTWDEWSQIQALSQRLGWIMPDLMYAKRQLQQTLNELSKQLALTPMARLRLNIQHLREDDDQDDGEEVPDGVASLSDYRQALAD